MTNLLEPFKSEPQTLDYISSGIREATTMYFTELWCTQKSSSVVKNFLLIMGPQSMEVGLNAELYL